MPCNVPWKFQADRNNFSTLSGTPFQTGRSDPRIAFLFIRIQFKAYKHSVLDFNSLGKKLAGPFLGPIIRKNNVVWILLVNFRNFSSKFQAYQNKFLVHFKGHVSSIYLLNITVPLALDLSSESPKPLWSFSFNPFLCIVALMIQGFKFWTNQKEILGWLRQK